MRWILFFLPLFFLSLQLTGQERNPKKGLGYGSNSVADLEAISQGVTWWYNWWYQPDNSEVLEAYLDYNMEFVPMAWYAGFNKEAMRSYLLKHPDVKYILGFNEPNFIEQSNLTPSQAAEAWPLIEEIAEEFDLKIVAPAMNYSWVGGAPSEIINGELVYYNDPFVWLDAFFEACPDCRIDYIAVHCYMNNVGALEWYIGEFKKYNKPIWLTEFCAWEGEVSLATQKNFMKAALAYLDNDQDVYRYAWFSGRSDGNPNNGLFAESGELTVLGKIYVGLYEDISNSVTLRVIDKTKGVVTNNAVWPNESVYTWLGNTTDWTAISNNGTWWAGMYNGLPDGRLEKTDDAWIWSFTFEPELGKTYNWNPGVFNDAIRSENSLNGLHENRNLVFTVSSTGILNGEVALVIENASTAIVTSENYSIISSLTPKLLDYSSQISVFPNPVREVVQIESPVEIVSITVYDYSGRIVYVNNGNNCKVELNHLEIGDYIMQIITVNNGFAMKKISIIN